MARMIGTQAARMNGNSYAMTSFISRLPPSEASGLREVTAPRIIASDGRANRYITTIKSPANAVLAPRSHIAWHRIIDAKETPAKPTKGAERNNQVGLPRGTQVSLISNLATS